MREYRSTLELLFAVRELSPTTAAQRSVLVSLLMHRSQDGTIRASIDQLARAMSLSRRTVLRELPKLERAGLVQISRGRQHHSSTYVLTIQRCQRDTAHDSPAVPSVHPAVPPVHPAVPSVQPSGAPMALSEDLSVDLSDPLDRIVAAYLDTFREVTEREPMVDGRERRHAQGLLRRTGSPARAIDVIQRAMRGRPPFFELGAIASRVNDVLARAEAAPISSTARRLAPTDMRAEIADEREAHHALRNLTAEEQAAQVRHAGQLLRAVGHG
jgi:hypothetical protein